MASFYVKWLKLAVVILFASAFIGLILYVVFTRDAIRSSNVEPPLISPPAEAVKRHPDQPGGLQIPNQDKTVFDLLETSGTQPNPETAAADELMDENDTSSTEPVTQSADQSVAEVTSSPTAAIEEVAVTEPTPVAPVKPVATEPAPVVTPVQKPESKPAVVAVAAAKAPVAETTTPATTATNAGEWGVQLASVKVKADADAAIKKLQNQFSVLKPYQGRVQSAVVGGGTSFRVQFVGLASRDAATNLCHVLGTKQPCLPVKK